MGLCEQLGNDKPGQMITKNAFRGSTIDELHFFDGKFTYQGFYPRHINLTLFRDGQPVSDHEITGGDLLPNADGTYQMRKSLEISAADKHKYTCSVTHLSLDNKLDIDLGNNLKG
uniref:Immunoglobulin C1-set domain-containing protein n=1 Tax=Cyprinus carpio TaxID=7962 RepID=A0A8C2BEU5_CYPCA